MRQLDVREAQQQLPQLAEEVERGGEVTITRDGVAVAVLSKAPAPVRGGFGIFADYAGLADQIAAGDDEVLQIIEAKAEHADFREAPEPGDA